MLGCRLFYKSHRPDSAAISQLHMGTLVPYTKFQLPEVTRRLLPHGLQGFGLTVLEAENWRSPNRLKILFINPYLLIPKWAKMLKLDQNFFVYNPIWTFLLIL